MKWLFFGGFLGPFSPKYGSINQRWSIISKRQSVNNLSNYFFKRKRDVPKVYSFGPFLGPIYPQKIKNTAKNQTFSKIYVFRIIKQCQSQVLQKNPNSYTINKKTPFFGTKMDLNCHLGPAQRVNINSQLAYDRTIHPQFMDPQKFLSICRSRLYSGETPIFFYFFFFLLVTQLGTILVVKLFK